MRIHSGARVRDWLLGATAAMVLASAQAAPVFNASVHVTSVGVRLDWSSDLGPDVINSVGNFAGTSTPVTTTAVATRDGRTISATMTHVPLYLLANEFWAASWHGSISIPGPGLYGLSAAAFSSSLWNFAIPGQTHAQNLATQFYWAAVWDVDSPDDIHPSFNTGGPARPLTGSDSGSFTLADFYSFGIPGFPTSPEFAAATFSLDANRPGEMTFSLRYAFAVRPIDPSVFDPPFAAPAPATWALLLAGLAGIGMRRSRRDR